MRDTRRGGSIAAFHRGTCRPDPSRLRAPAMPLKMGAPLALSRNCRPNRKKTHAMRQPLALCSPLLITLAIAPFAEAATLYVSPTGTDSAACTRAAPCSLTYSAANAKAGDTVILLDGVYKSQLLVTNSGTASAWITFQADECATPIIEGKGIETNTGEAAVDQPTGVGSSTATYLRFVGLVARGWNIAFSNGWTGEGTTNSNGHFEFKYCIADGNGRTGFTFFSAEGLHIQNCISAHNGCSVEHSWSSGMTLYEAQGSSNLIEGSVSFENTDAEQHTDGSGFIADENSNNATFINNIAFRNGGSCLRLTTSSGVKFINNTCYHNAQDPQATGPDNPGEIYFTNDPTRSGVNVKNNVFIATGSGPGAKAVLGQPTSGWSNNVVQDGGAVTVFTSPEGTNPDFTLAASATNMIGKGSSAGGTPAADIGFDPKCIVKRAPTMIGNYTRSSWWQYSIDIDYIKSIGGVAKCFRPKTRSGTPDIGAYANGAVTAVGTCVPASTGGAPSTGGTNGGGAGSGGANAGGATNSATTSRGGTTANAGGTANTGKGGTSNIGGTANSNSNSTNTSNAKGGSSASSNTTTVATSGGTGGTVGGSSTTTNLGNGGANSSTTSGPAGIGGTASGTIATSTSASNVGGSQPLQNAGGTNASVPGIGGDQQPGSGCGCRVAARESNSAAFAGLGLLGLSLLRLRRRRSMKQ